MEMQDRIKERRIQLGYTQEELAKKLGLQKSAIAKYENGRVENIKRSIILKMSEVLDCSPCYLMALDDEETWKPDFSTSKFSSIRQDENQLLSYYNQLNSIGKDKAMDYVSDLTENEKYTKDAKSEVKNPSIWPPESEEYTFNKETYEKTISDNS